MLTIKVGLTPKDSAIQLVETSHTPRSLVQFMREVLPTDSGTYYTNSEWFLEELSNLVLHDEVDEDDVEVLYYKEHWGKPTVIPFDLAEGGYNIRDWEDLARKLHNRWAEGINA